jgi:hypothetical protein
MPSEAEAMAEAADLAAVEGVDFAVGEVAADFAGVEVLAHFGAAEAAVHFAAVVVHSAGAEEGACFGVEVMDSGVADLEEASAEDSAAGGSAGSDVASGAAIDSFLASATRRGIGPVTLMIPTIMDTPTLMGILMAPTGTDTTHMRTTDTAHMDHMLLIRPLLL